MKLLKKHLNKKNQKTNTIENNKIEPSESEFTSGLIVKVTLPEPIVDIKMFKVSK